MEFLVRFRRANKSLNNILYIKKKKKTKKEQIVTKATNDEKYLIKKVKFSLPKPLISALLGVRWRVLSAGLDASSSLFELESAAIPKKTIINFTMKNHGVDKIRKE